MLERQELDYVHNGKEKTCEIIIFTSFFLEPLSKHFFSSNIVCDPIVKNRADDFRD